MLIFNKMYSILFIEKEFVSLLVSGVSLGIYALDAETRTLLNLLIIYGTGNWSLSPCIVNRILIYNYISK